MYNPYENYLAAMASAQQGIVPFSAQVGNPGMPLPQLIPAGQNVDAWQIQALQAQACNQLYQAQHAQAQAQALQARQAMQQQQQALFGFVNQPLMPQLPGIQMPLFEQPNVALASSTHHAAFTSRFPAPSSSMSTTQDFHLEQTCVAAPKEVLPVEQPSVASASSSHRAAVTSRFPAPSSSMSSTQYEAKDFHLEQTCVAAPKEVLPASKKSLSFQTYEIKPTKGNKKQPAKSSERYSFPFMSYAEPALVENTIEEVPLHSEVSPKPAEDDSGCKPLEDIFEGGEAAAPPSMEQSSEEGTLSSVAELLASKFPETSSDDVSAAAVIPSIKKSLSLKNKKEPKETLQHTEEEVEEENLITVVVSSDAESDDDDFMTSKGSKRSNITHENVKQWMSEKKLGGGKEKAASTSRTPRKNQQTIGSDLPSPAVGYKRKPRTQTVPIRYSNEEDKSVDDVTTARPAGKNLPKKQKPAEENLDKLTRKELKERLIAALKAKAPENKADNGTD